jgi:hypothetical protein
MDENKEQAEAVKQTKNPKTINQKDAIYVSSVITFDIIIGSTQITAIGTTTTAQGRICALLLAI